MTSNINYLSINENFPVAGQDNDTQVFRDNFRTIKDNFRYTKQDIESLQNNTGGLQCTETSSGSSFGKKTIEDALLTKTAFLLKPDGVVSGSYEIDWEAGLYRTITVGDNISFTLTNFAETDDAVTNKRVGNVILELKGGAEGDIKTVTFNVTAGAVIKKSGFPALTGTYTSGSEPDIELSSSDNPVLVEIWQHTSSTILIKYIGKFE